MKSKVVNTLKLSRKAKTKYRKLGLVLFSIALTTIIIRALNQQYNSRRANEAKALIRDVRSLKTELEQKFNISLKEDVDCTQSQGKSSNRNSAWGCHINIKSGSRALDRLDIETTAKEKLHLVDPLMLSGERNGTEYSYRQEGGPGCGVYFGEGFSVGCSFSINNAASEEVFKELGISRPASNND